MHLQHAMLRLNGRCGYTLKPDFVLEERYNPNAPLSLETLTHGMSLEVAVVAGRHLHLPKSMEAVAMTVKVEIVGLPSDSTFRTLE